MPKQIPAVFFLSRDTRRISYGKSEYLRGETSEVLELEMIYGWGSSIQQNSSVLLFIHSHEISLSFKIENETISVLFQNGAIKIVTSTIDGIPNILIKGEKESIGKLLKGELLLRELISLQQISIEASFRKVLFLETLFKLAHLQFLSEISKK